jgi:fructose-1,6-bisphosphatase I / sedoheptulose-1,7-bisphosphatase
MRATLREVLTRAQGAPGGPSLDLVELICELATSFRAISGAVERASIAGALGGAATSNGHGEPQALLDVIANELVVTACERSGCVAAVASEELPELRELTVPRERGRYLVVVDPLDGSTNLGVNVPVGTIFSILEREDEDEPLAALLRPGDLQVCAGYAIYGPSTMLVLTVGDGVQGFTLDRETGELVWTHPDLRVPEEARELAVDASNERFWEAPVKRYVTECRAGTAGPRGGDFDMRWVASLVAEVHRIVVRGGVFLHPRDTKAPPRAGRLRLLYEANPMALIVERAGGAASTGRGRILDEPPVELHQRIPVILGSCKEVERLVRYHHEHDANGEPFKDPLFNTRSLFSLQ